MKRNGLKRALGVGLSLSLVFGLAGCGNGGKKMENAALAKENVYKLQEFELPELGGDDYSVRGSFYKDGTIYMMAQVYHWSEGSDDTDMKMISMKDDGTDIKMVDMEIPEWRTQPGSGGAMGGGLPGTMARAVVPETGSEDESEGEEGEEQESGAEDTAEPEGEGGTEPEGSAEGDEGAEAGDEGESADDTGAADTIDDDMLIGKPDVYESSNYGNFCFSGDGMIYGIRNYYYEDYSSEEYSSVQKMYVSCWNADGSFVWEKELEGLVSEEEYIYVNNMNVTSDGTLHLLMSGNGAYKMTVDAQGNVSEREALPEEIYKVFNNVSSIMNKDDGTFLIMYYDEADWQKQYLVSYDPSTGQLGQPSQMPASIMWYGYNTMSAGKSSDLIFSNNKGIYSYTIGQENCVEKMNFINSDLNITNFNALVELDENSFIGIFNENYGEGVRAGIFTYVDPKDIPDKAVLVLAGNYVGSDMKQRVVEYNRSNEEYRITIKEYDSYNTYEDYTAGVTQLNNDITSGNMPDILMTSGLPVENYVAKGLLADIGKMIEEDEELSKVEFVQNVFDAYSVDGKLHYVIPYFGLNTVVGKKSIVGDRNSWTMADMKALMETLPEGTNAFGELDRESFMNIAMGYCGADFIDISTGKCNFDSQNFIDMMEFAKTLPESLDQPDYGEDYWRDYETQYRENRTILRSTYLGSFQNVNYSVYGSFGEEVSYIGFPTESGMGAYIQAGDAYAISARSANVDGAWEFLRYYLTEDYQKELGWGMSVHKKLFLESAQEATKKPYYIDENGEKQEYDDTYYINGEEIILDPLTQEQVDNLVNYIYSIKKAYYGNTDITNIISEETASFFAGQKSAQEVAKVIQSRAQLYVDERR